MKRVILLIFLILATSAVILNVIVLAQQKSAATETQNSDTTGLKTAGKSAPGRDTSSQDSGKRGFSANVLLDLFKEAEVFGYFLALDFILGVVFLFQQILVLNREMKDARKIPIDQIKRLGYEEIEKMFKQVKEDEPISVDEEKDEMERLPLLKRLFMRKKASAFQLAHRLFLVFENKRSTAEFNEITSNFVQYLKDMFNPFLTRLAFLSDTAGALGLLGTVWGMFMVFHRGSPDQSEILKGMGVALSTTIIGLVISIILNSLTTLANNKFDRHLATINRVSEVLQERLMKDEIFQSGGPAQVVLDADALTRIREQTPAAGSAKPDGKSSEEKVTPKKRRKILMPSEIKIVSGNNQVAEVGSELPQPIVVEVIDEDGNPLEGQEVAFVAQEGAGNFPNDSRVRKILTNEEGRAETAFSLGKKAGEKKITITLDSAEVQPKSLLVMAKPASAAKLVDVDGNYQTGELGKRLPRPFIVAVRDKFDNPIPRYEVNFSLSRGSGKFQDSQNAHLLAYTNESGFVEVYFIIGNERGARDIEIEAKKVNPSKINYEIFAV
ncbi:MAG: hypothetical protein GXO74_01150 [Calditrichaeota bacterium]|nr:hypothetical protein [Calditrichota bacterium]